MPENLSSLSSEDILKIIGESNKRIRTLEAELLRIKKTFQSSGYKLLSTGDTDMQLDAYPAVKVTPNNNHTYTTTVPPSGHTSTIIILTSGTSSYTITFGSGFKTTGTLATGTVSSRVFVLQFISDGTSLYETSRTTAMVA